MDNPLKLNENQSYDVLFMQKYKPSFSRNKITFHQELSAQDVIDIEAHINAMTQAERDAFNAEEKRKADIIAKADAEVLARYSEKKQRKFLSITSKLMDKKLIRSQPLTPEEEAMLQSIRDVDAEITAIREIENTAITLGTPADEVVF